MNRFHRAILLFLLLIPSIVLGHDKFILVTVPKCGSHLIIHALNKMIKRHDQRQLASDFDDFLKQLALAEKKSTYMSTHQLATQEALDYVAEHGYKVILIIRDPRDQLISHMYYIQNGYWPQLPFGNMTNEEQIEELITGTRFGFRCYEQCFSNRLGWQNLGPEVVYVTTFEKLVGSRGGGSDDVQREEIKRIGAHIGLNLSDRDCRKIAKASYGKGYTFRKGQIGSWKSHFTEEHKEIYKLLYGQELIDLGYESDLEW